MTLLSTEIFQSINPFLVVTLTPLLVAFFAWLKRRNKEPSTPAKVGWGMLITAVAPVIMIFAVSATNGGVEKGTMLWLVGTYLFVSLAELFLSPMGLSLVSKLAPKRYTAMMMGGWFLAMSIGSKMAGVLSGLWESIEIVWIFVINCGSALLAAVLMGILTPRIRTIMEKHEKGKQG